jgi:hypothetical protein
MGQKLIQHTIPEIHFQLKRIADTLDILVKREYEKKAKVINVLHGIRMVKVKPGEYLMDYMGDQWRVYREQISYMYWWYGEKVGDNSAKAFKSDTKNEVLQKIKISYNLPSKNVEL